MYNADLHTSLTKLQLPRLPSHAATMNDPGLDESIQNDANDVEDQKGEVQHEQEENEQAFLEPRHVYSFIYGAGKMYTRLSVASGLFPV